MPLRRSRWGERDSTEIVFDSHGTMSVAHKNSYYSLNRLLLQICGVWPYDKTKHQHLRSALIFVLLIAYMIYQVFRS